MRPFVQHYDAIFSDKDYGADIDAFAVMVGAPLTEMRILEIGAGTGSQSVRLAALARELTAVEIDQDFALMLNARLENISNAVVHVRKVEQLREANFDAAAAFFHVLNYVDDENALASLLGAIAQRLRRGSVFVADVWHGDVVLTDPPKPEVRTKPLLGGGLVRQEIMPELYQDSRRVRLRYDISLAKEGDLPIRFQEVLDLRLWLRDELSSMLRNAGFSAPEFFDYRLFPAPASDQSWRAWLRSRRL